MSQVPTICPKCGKPSWKPYVMTIKGRGKLEIVDGVPVVRPYTYQVYRHPDGRRRTPRKHTVKVAAPQGADTA